MKKLFIAIMLLVVCQAYTQEFNLPEVTLPTQEQLDLAEEITDSIMKYAYTGVSQELAENIDAWQLLHSPPSDQDLWNFQKVLLVDSFKRQTPYYEIGKKIWKDSHGDYRQFFPSVMDSIPITHMSDGGFSYEYIPFYFGDVLVHVTDIPKESYDVQGFAFRNKKGFAINLEMIDWAYSIIVNICVRSGNQNLIISKRDFIEITVLNELSHVLYPESSEWQSEVWSLYANSDFVVIKRIITLYKEFIEMQQGDFVYRNAGYKEFSGYYQSIFYEYGLNVFVQSVDERDVFVQMEEPIVEFLKTKKGKKMLKKSIAFLRKEYGF